MASFQILKGWPMVSVEDVMAEVMLKHMTDYDPAAAREYYLRTRKLKGRKKAVGPVSASRRTSRAALPAVTRRPKAKAVVAKPKKSNAQKAKEVKARVASLEKQLEQLRAVLALLVKQAKARSGVETPTKDSKKEPATTRKNSKQKAEAAKASKEYYEKHKNDDPSKRAAELEAKIAEVKGKIADMRAELAASRKQATRKSSSVGARATTNK